MDEATVGGAVAGFEVFTKSLVTLAKEPTLTIQKNGVLSLNLASEVALGSPRAVQLLFDSESRIVGLRAVDPGAGDSCAVRAVAGPGAAPFVISAAAFLRFYAIDHCVSRRWRASLDADGILCVALDSESVVVTSNRAKIPAVTSK